MPTIQTTITRAFEPAEGNGPTGPWVRHDFKDAEDRKFSTFKGDVASVTKSLLGQPVEVEFNESENNG